MEQSADNQFRSGVLSPNTGHQGAAAFRCAIVCHGSAPSSAADRNRTQALLSLNTAFRKKLLALRRAIISPFLGQVWEDTELSESQENRYKRLLEHIFFAKEFGAYKAGTREIEFARKEMERAAKALNIELPKNLGDVVYAIRYRTPLPRRIVETQPEGMEWAIEGAGRSRYRFCLVPANRIVPNPALRAIKIPDATPEIIGAYALNDEQALLARVRYNRLIDIFLGVTAYSLQNHMRTTVAGIGQIEIDEVYVGVDRRGAQYVIPVQAKGGKDQLAVVQTKQDLACCAEKFPSLVCRSVSAQFIDMEDKKKKIAMFELAVESGRVEIVEERHYRLVPASEIGSDDLNAYRSR